MEDDSKSRVRDGSLSRVAKLVCTCRPDDVDLCPRCEDDAEAERQYERYLERRNFETVVRDRHDSTL